MMLGPRLGRYAEGLDPLPLGNPVNACMGLFVLWWGWLAFNSGSTYGVSGAKWQYAARAAVMTMMGCKLHIKYSEFVLFIIASQRIYFVDFSFRRWLFLFGVSEFNIIVVRQTKKLKKFATNIAAIL